MMIGSERNLLRHKRMNLSTVPFDSDEEGNQHDRFLCTSVPTIETTTNARIDETNIDIYHLLPAARFRLLRRRKSNWNLSWNLRLFPPHERCVSQIGWFATVHPCFGKEPCESENDTSWLPARRKCHPVIISAGGRREHRPFSIDYAPLTSGIFASGLAEEKTPTVPSIVMKRAQHREYTLPLSLDAVENCLVGPAEYQCVVKPASSCPVWVEQSSAANWEYTRNMKYRVFIIFMDGPRYSDVEDKYTGIGLSNLIADFKAVLERPVATGNYQYYDTDG